MASQIPILEDQMKIIGYRKINPTNYNNEKIKDVAGRVVIGKGDGAENFYMRVFEISPGGYTVKHTHDWEHEIFIHSGKGEVYSTGEWLPISTDDVIFIPENEEHQIRNLGNDALILICLIPSKAPEM
jgi:quercetin dioxygenase-like cupin family protein